MSTSINETMESIEDIEDDAASIPQSTTKRSRRVKPKVAADWSEDDISRLIVCVENEPCLWNAGEKDYSNNIARQNSWEKIASEFNNKYSHTELNAKWTNLRIQYRSYYATKTKSGQGAEFVVKWKYFGAMSFIGRAEELQRAGSISNLEMDENTSDAAGGSIIYVSSPASIDPSTSTTKRSRAATANNTPSASMAVIETMREAVAAIKQQQTQDDRNSSFCKYILAELQALPEDKANLLRLHLQRVVLDFNEAQYAEQPTIQAISKETTSGKQYVYVMDGNNIEESSEDNS